MADKKNMLFYSSWYDIIQECVENDEDKLFLLDSLLRYGLKGEMIETSNPVFRMFQKQAFVQIDSAQEKHDKRVEAGRKGGKAGKGEAKARYGNKNAKRKQTQPNDNVNVNVNVNDNDNDNDNDNILHPSAFDLNGQASDELFDWGED